MDGVSDGYALASGVGATAEQLQGGGGLGDAAGGARSVADAIRRLGHVAADRLAAWRCRLGRHLIRRSAGAADVAPVQRQQHELDEDIAVVHGHRDVGKEDVAGAGGGRGRRSGAERAAGDYGEG